MSDQPVEKTYSDNTQISMHPAGFETTFSAGEHPQTSSLDRAATGTGTACPILSNIILTRARAINMINP